LKFVEHAKLKRHRRPPFSGLCRRNLRELTL
jgi:hypothetical protein